MKFPDNGDLFDLGRFGIIIITSSDLSKEEGTFKLFQSMGEAQDWLHDCSLEQSPFWHEKYCKKCKLKDN